MGRKKLIDLSPFEETMLELLMYKETDLVAQELGVTERTIYQRLYRLRKRVEEAQNLVNKVNAFKNKSPRIRKLLTQAKLLKKKGKEK
jgi:hypothetical protein